MTQRSRTVGVLYAGEMGASLAAVLRAGGVPVVTTLHGRSNRTADRCQQAGITVLDSLADVVRQSEVVISVVPPAAAESVASEYCQLARLAPPTALYVDLNSIRPELAVSLAGMIERKGIGFVDAAINGLAKNLPSSATLYLSGARAPEVAGLFGGAIRVQVLGSEPGTASSLKMLLAGLSKGVCALFAELGLLAGRLGMLKELTEATAQIYPGISALVDRMLPTYAQHAGRRAMEMHELEETARAAALEPCLIAAICQIHEQIADVSFDTPVDSGGWTVASLIHHLAASECLAGQVQEGKPSTS